MAETEHNAAPRGQNAGSQGGAASTSANQPSGSSASGGSGSARGDPNQSASTQSSTQSAGGQSASRQSGSGTSGASPETERTIPRAEETGSRGSRTDMARRRGQFPGGMPLTPWGLMRQLMGDDLERLLGGTRGRSDTASSGRAGTSMSTIPGQGVAASGTFVPDIEVIQDQNAIRVRADLPGMKPDEIDVSVEDGMVAISGERRDERREEQEGVIRTERSYGAFYRAVPLPDGANTDEVSATFRDGVLEITVPVTQREQGRRVPVK